ncbi:MAG: hypothetical protein AB1593_10285 [Pseudomonadota bacterium]
MRLIVSLLAALLFTAPGLAAGTPAGFDLKTTATPAACAAASLKYNDQVAQLACCKKNKGVCGCRAGKIVCCDGTVSNEPGCTCHGDEGIVE